MQVAASNQSSGQRSPGGSARLEGFIHWLRLYSAKARYEAQVAETSYQIQHPLRANHHQAD